MRGEVTDEKVHKADEEVISYYLGGLRIVVIFPMETLKNVEIDRTAWSRFLCTVSCNVIFIATDCDELCVYLLWWIEGNAE